ncbi:MAG: GNAT family N-acetyltransferase [Alphaproteobacteria bacterium]|nr:GNAT family N-acetyltransferase [Alphaproteobacteria bacterium]MDE2109778.1 GNAT family N-acetyltransferase [Alphaproteobacteria bacterium]MDE2495665.1 GNAT family N-acetyltransferase [Alphaproteobacteria bacterium]
MIRIERLDAGAACRHQSALAEVLHDCVAGGASISFMWPFSREQAAHYWKSIVAAVREDRACLLGAFDDDRLGGTVQLWLDGPCNQRHRGDVRKLLVHRAMRRRGMARRLMQALEAEARSRQLSLLTLDTATGSDGERLYRAMDWQSVGVIPRYALWPDGRFCDTTVFYKELAVTAA